MNKTLKLVAFMSTLLVVGCGETPTTNGSVPTTTNPETSTVINNNAPILTVKNDMTININEKLHYLNLVSAVDEVDGNISHLINVEMPNGVSMEGGYLWEQLDNGVKKYYLKNLVKPINLFKDFKVIFNC